MTRGAPGANALRMPSIGSLLNAVILGNGLICGQSHDLPKAPVAL